MKRIRNTGKKGVFSSGSIMIKKNSMYAFICTSLSKFVCVFVFILVSESVCLSVSGLWADDLLMRIRNDLI